MIEHRHPVAHAHDHAHVVLDQEHGDPQLRTNALEQPGHLAGLRRVHPGGRLVEQQQLGLTRERTRDLETPLVTIREVAGQLVVAATEPDVAEPAARRLADLLLFGRVAGQAERRVDQSRAHPGMLADHYILERGHVPKEADVLERPADAHSHDLVRPGAAKDADPVEHADVPRWPHDRDEQRHHEEPQGNQRQDLPKDGCSRSEEGAGHDGHGNRSHKPENRLRPGAHGPGDHPLAEELDRPRGGIAEARDHVEERGLARSVRADEADDRAGRNLEVHVADCDETAETFGNPSRAKEDLAWGGRGHGRGGGGARH